MKRPVAIATVLLGLAGPALALERSVCVVEAVCAAATACESAPKQIVFGRMTPIDGLWEGQLDDETLAVYPGRRAGVWTAEGANGPHLFEIELDGSIVYTAPSGATWQGHCEAWT